MRSAAEYVRHFDDCPSDRTGRDEDCDCGAVSLLDGMEAAWALLWATQTSDSRVHKARAILRELLPDDGPARGIASLPEWARPTAPSVAEAIAGDYP